MVSGKLKDLSAAQRRVIRAWCMYDWANSGYATAGGAAIFPVYFVFLFKDSLGESVSFLGITFTGSSTWSLGIAFATALVAITSPVLGVIADRVAIKKILLWIYTIVGSVATCLMFFSAYTGEPWLWFLAMFILANIGFAGCLVFYNTFSSPHRAPGTAGQRQQPGIRLRLRGRRAAVGSAPRAYPGNAGHAVCRPGDPLGDSIHRVLVVWVGAVDVQVMPEPHIPNEMHGLRPARALRLAFTELSHTFREMRGFRVILIYLVSYLLFNRWHPNGAERGRGLRGGHHWNTAGLQHGNYSDHPVRGGIRSHGISWLASRIATKGALLITLVGWSLLVLFGVGIAPLAPDSHQAFDYQLAYQAETGRYLVEAAPEPGGHRRWTAPGGGTWPWRGVNSESGGPLAEGATLSEGKAAILLAQVRESESAPYTISLTGGSLDENTAIGRLHRSNLGDGPIDWWPAMVRRLVWERLGLDAPYQWLLLGVGVGLVMGAARPWPGACSPR